MKLFSCLSKTVLLVPVLVLGLTACAQKNEHFGLNFTPSAGVNFSYAGMDAQETRAFKISPEGGVAVKLDLTKHFGLTMGVYYTQRAKYYSYNSTESFFYGLTHSFFGSFSGADTIIEQALGVTAGYINDTIYSNYSGKVNIQYLQVPLMATLDLGHFSISAGGYVAWKLSASATETLTQRFPMLTTFQPTLATSGIEPLFNLFTTQYTALDHPVVTTISDVSWVKSTDYGLMGDLTARFNERFTMSAKVSYGLGNYSNNPTLYPGKHFSVSTHLGFVLGKVKGTALPVRFF